MRRPTRRESSTCRCTCTCQPTRAARVRGRCHSATRHCGCGPRTMRRSCHSSKFRAPVWRCMQQLRVNRAWSAFTHGHHDQHIGVFLMLRGRAHCRLSECRRRGLPLAVSGPASAWQRAVRPGPWIELRPGLRKGSSAWLICRVGSGSECTAKPGGGPGPPRSGPGTPVPPICRNRGLIPARGSYRGVCG